MGPLGRGCFGAVRPPKGGISRIIMEATRGTVLGSCMPYKKNKETPSERGERAAGATPPPPPCTPPAFAVLCLSP